MRESTLRLLLAVCLLSPAVAHAQDEDDSPPGETTPAQNLAKTPADAGKKPAKAAPAPVAPPPVDSEGPPPAAIGAMDDLPVAELQALDKITARVSKLEVRIGQTASFGSLSFVVKACRKAPPENTPESAAFLQVWEQKAGEDSHWVYSGWMFASSPALAAMDHPVYDIWLVDCKKESTSAASSTVTSPAAPPPAK